jgi:hypothetical protein
MNDPKCFQRRRGHTPAEPEHGDHRVFDSFPNPFRDKRHDGCEVHRAWNS